MMGQSIWRGEDIEHAISARELTRFLTLNQIPFEDISEIGDALIARSRNHIAMHFLKSDCDVPWITDGDVVFDAEDVLRVCSTVAESPYKIIGGAYVTRQAPHRLALRLPEGVVVRFDKNKPELVEVDFLATGFMAIHRSVFEAMRERLIVAHDLAYEEGERDYYPFFSTFLNEARENWHEELSEDFAFAKRAKDAGFPCYLDTSIRLGHVGTYIYTIEDIDRPEKIPADVFAFKRTGNDIIGGRIKQSQVE